MGHVLHSRIRPAKLVGEVDRTLLLTRGLKRTALPLLGSANVLPDWLVSPSLKADARLLRFAIVMHGLHAFGCASILAPGRPLMEVDVASCDLDGVRRPMDMRLAIAHPPRATTVRASTQPSQVAGKALSRRANQASLEGTLVCCHANAGVPLPCTWSDMLAVLRKRQAWRSIYICFAASSVVP